MPKPAVPQYIYLVRHARPLVELPRWCNYEGACRFVTDYDTADVEEVTQVPELLQNLPVKRVFCSTFNRSRLTARALFGPEVELVEDKKFREFERKMLRLPFRLPLWFWRITSRVLWLLGWKPKGIESFREARQRAREAATHLEEEAAHEGLAVLVAHGFLNKFIERALKRRGWQVMQTEGIKYLGVTVLVKG